MSEDVLVEIELSNETFSRLNKMAKDERLTVEQMLLKLISALKDLDESSI